MVLSAHMNKDWEQLLGITDQELQEQVEMMGPAGMFG
jgi:hypothetical protein